MLYNSKHNRRMLYGTGAVLKKVSCEPLYAERQVQQIMNEPRDSLPLFAPLRPFSSLY